MPTEGRGSTGTARSLASLGPARSAELLTRAVPRSVGRPTGEADDRHRVVLAVLALHLPLILVLGLLEGALGWTAVGAAAVLVALAVAIFAPRGLVRESAAAMGLVLASVTMQAVTLGAPEMVLHAMLVAILVSLYQDWRVQAVALATFAVWYLVVGMLDYPVVFGSGSGTWLDVLLRSLVRLGFLAGAMAVARVFWAAMERGHRTEASYREQLHEIESLSASRLREAEEMRENLIATVSHEFRTPLTAIQGNTATLIARDERLSGADRARLLNDIAAAGDRLSALLEDMLAAASATSSRPDEISDVTAELREFAEDPTVRSLGMVVRAPDGLSAAIRPSSLHQILAALASHAGENADRGRAVQLRALPEPDSVEVSLIYHGGGLSSTELAHLFEPFGSKEAARTGHPSSLRLYLVRRLAEAHGGTVAAEIAGSRVVLRVHLPSPQNPDRDDAEGGSGDVVAATTGGGAGPDSTAGAL